MGQNDFPTPALKDPKLLKKGMSILDLRTATSAFLEKTLTVLFPPRCMLCDELLPYGKSGFCAECKENIPGFEPDCRVHTASTQSDLTRLYGAYRYEGHMRDAVLRLKFDGRKNLAKEMAKLISDVNWPDIFYEDMRTTNYLVPVPLHKSRKKERGYNQAALLAEDLSKIYGVQTLKAIVRIRKTSFMYELSPEERLLNIRDAFAAVPVLPAQLGNIMLIDDIHTTGATVGECSRVLKKLGASKICALTFTC